MGSKRVHTDLNLQGNSITGLATAAVGDSSSLAANTEFVAKAALKGSGRWLDILPLQTTALVTGLLGVESVVAGSDFKWDSEFLPTGRSLYLEIYGSGSALSSLMSAQLYTLAGVAVPNSTVTITGTAGALARGSAFTLVSGTVYQIHFKTTILGTGSLKLARLIIL